MRVQTAMRSGLYFADVSTQDSFDALVTPVVATEAAQSLKTFNTIKGVFDRVCSHVKADAMLAKRLIDFQMTFSTKNEDHTAFFGGVLTGVHVVRFTSVEMNRFFSDVMDINELELEDELHQLKAIVADRKVSGDVFNNACLWLVHKFLTTTLITDKRVSERAAMAAALVLHYRYLTSLLSWYYKYPANQEDAEAAYARLTKKSAIKQYGSWHNLLEHRCKDFFPPDGLHGKTIVDYSDDFGIVYALNDSQGRIRSMMKHLMSELIAAKHAGARVRSTSATVELDGEGFLRDKARGLETYSNYLFSVMADEHAFIKQDIVGVIVEAIHTAPPSQINEALKWMSMHFKTLKGKGIEPFVQEVLVHSFRYMEDNRTVVRETTSMADFILRLKGVYMSNRSTDPQLLRCREMAEEIVKTSISSRNPAIISAVKTSLMLYIVMRSFSMNYYSK